MKEVARAYGGPCNAQDDAAVAMLCARSLKAAEPEFAKSPAYPTLLFQRDAVSVAIYPRMRRMELRPLLACNHRCAFCNSSDPYATDATTNGVRDILAHLPDWDRPGLCYVAVSGGEPTLLPDLPELVAAIAERGLTVELQTNGMALADRAYLAHLQERGLRVVLISLHSHDPAVSDGKITGFQGAWARTVAGIDAALELGLVVHLSCVIHRDNHEDLLAYFQFVADRWGRRVFTRLAFVAPTGSARTEIERTIPPLPEVLPHLARALAFCRERRLRVGIVRYCGLPPCLHAPYLEFNKVFVEQASDFPEDHTKLPACTTCTISSACPGLWTRVYEAHGDPGIRPLLLSRAEQVALRWLAARTQREV